MIILPYITLIIGIIWLIKLNPITLKNSIEMKQKEVQLIILNLLIPKTNKIYKLTLIETNNKVKFIKQQKILRPFQILDDKSQ